MKTGFVRVATTLGVAAALGAGAALAQQPPVSPAAPCLERLPADPLSLNLRDANVQTTLRILAQQYRINMIVTEEVTARVTLDFFRVPARDVFGAIIETANLRCVVSGDVLRVSTGARLKAEEDERLRQAEARQRLDAETRKRLIEAQQAEEELKATLARGPIVEETIRLRYSDAEEIAKTLQGILGLPPEGREVPLPQIYAPPIPVNIPDRPQPAPTVTAPPTTPGQSEALAKGLTVKAHKPTNSIFIRYYQNDLERIKRLIRESLDVPLPQVQIVGQMVIVNRNALEQIGVQWGGSAIGQPAQGRNPAVVGRGFGSGPPGVGGTPVVGTFGRNPNFTPNVSAGATGASFLPVDPISGVPTGSNLVNLPVSLLPTLATPGFGILFGLIGNEFNLNLAIQALETQGKARRIAEPKIVTVENAKAEMQRGAEVPFTSVSQAGATPQVQFKDALLRLQVTPSVIREGNVNKIRMKVIVENNEPDFSRAALQLGNPQIFKRRAETEVVVTEGQRLVIGGVSIDNSGTTLRQVPMLARIPVLGWLFKSRELNSDSEELIVILTPTVVAAQANAAPGSTR
jgi:type IV pilus assembly protein PilQ